MTIALLLALGIFMGMIVGMVFEKSCILDPKQLIEQFALKRYTVLKVFLTAIITSMVIYLMVDILGFERLHWKMFALWPDIVGGILLGIGIVMSGACPSTLFGQIGVGYKDARFVLLGAMVGAFFYYWIGPCMRSWIKENENVQVQTLDEVLGLSYPMTLILFIIIFMVVLYFLEKYRPWQEDTLQEELKNIKDFKKNQPYRFND